MIFFTWLTKDLCAETPYEKLPAFGFLSETASTDLLHIDNLLSTHTIAKTSLSFVANFSSFLATSKGRISLSLLNASSCSGVN